MIPRQFAPLPAAFTQMIGPLIDTVPMLANGPVGKMFVNHCPCAGAPPEASDWPFAWYCAGNVPSGVGSGPLPEPAMKSLSGPWPFECVAAATPGNRATASSATTPTSSFLIYPSLGRSMDEPTLSQR
jgi:hypothetical protein